MALRHAFPLVALPDLRKAAEPERPPTLPRPPRDVSFRPGRDMEEICREIMGVKAVNLSAGVGAGKSTKLPLALAECSQLQVVHVVPSRLLALDLYRYLSKQNPQAGYVLAKDPSDEYSSKVTITHSAAVWARIFARAKFNRDGGFDKSVNPLGKCILLLDESHESDGYTYALHKLCYDIPGVASTVFASATHKADGFPMREPAGALEALRFKPMRPAEWDPIDAGFPWTYSALRGNALIFIDNDLDAQALVGKYNDLGASAYRLSAKMEDELFMKAMDEMRHPDSGIVVLVADYSFRSGFTFDVSCVIDSCLVGYYHVLNGEIKRAYRVAFELENHQAFGRGGRTKGSSCTLWWPEVELKPAICLLDGVEIDLAAMLFRLAGYAPPALLRGASLSTGLVPRDLSASLNGMTPLCMLPPQTLMELVRPFEPEVKPEPEDVVDETAVVASYMQEDTEVTPFDLFAAAGGKRRSAAVDIQDGLEFLQQLHNYGGKTAIIVPGQYYQCDGLEPVDVDSRLYGDDWVKALQELTAKPGLFAGFDPGDQLDIIMMLLMRYNKSLAAHRGINSMLMAKDSLTRLASNYPSMVRDWSGVVAADQRESLSMYNQLAALLNKIRPESLHYVMVDVPLRSEQTIAQHYADMLLKILPRGGSDGGGIGKYIDETFEKPKLSIDSKHLELDVKNGFNDETAKVWMKPIRVGRKPYHDVFIAADKQLRWGADDYKEVLRDFVQQAQLDPHKIRRLEVMSDPRIEGDSILQYLRDVPAAKVRRTSRAFTLKRPRVGEIESGK